MQSRYKTLEELLAGEQHSEGGVSSVWGEELVLTTVPLGEEQIASRERSGVVTGSS